MMRSWRERFVEVDRGYETPCLEWMGNRINGGYGQVQINGRKHYVHRLVWTEAHGDPGEQKVLHRCDNRRCGRLEHLFVGTQAALASRHGVSISTVSAIRLGKRWAYVS